MKFMKNPFLPFLSLLILSALAVGCSDEMTPPEDDLAAEITAIENGLTPGLQVKGNPVDSFSIAEGLEKYGVPNVSIAVIENGKVKWARGYGIKHPDHDGEVDASTLFQAASISKPVAAMGVHRLAQEGKVDLDENVNNYLTSWKLPENKFTEEQPVTLRHLMTHTGGITVHGFPGYAKTDKFPTDLEVLNGEGNTDPIRVDTFPGVMNRYSGGGYTIMERVVEDVSGQSFTDYMQAAVLGPLGMELSTYAQPLPAAREDEIAVAIHGDGSVYAGDFHSYPEQAAAGLWTTPTDLAKFAIGVQRAYGGTGDEVLNQEYAKIMLTQHEHGHGHGPGVGDNEGDLVFMHGGKNAGYTCHLYAWAERGTGMVAMSSADNARPLIQDIERAIAEYYGWSFEKPTVVELIEIPAADLPKFEGTFVFRPQEYQVSVVVKEGKVTIIDENDGVEEYPLDPTGPMEFIDLSDGARISFEADDTGKIVAAIQDGRFRFDRVE
ncbi:serine hydrolase [Lewinella sp. W8]|uniref:serine hydrolase domain-containing protein n=1 Tax=Lewinella sp. W8 TaxID=2528208 RepID=UPI00106803A9|nr:serine hydrolase domain-containing protein [Lewinella sp. W8]MTB52212.1 serine hydrolase [Lewinella sp. W8]